MNQTPVSLIERLRATDDQEAWERFVDLYTPLIYGVAKQTGLPADVASDVVQEVLSTLVSRMRRFIYDPSRSFRAWLRTVTRNHLYNYVTSTANRLPITQETALQQVAAPEQIPTFDDQEYKHHLVHRAMQIMKSDFHSTTWTAFWEIVVTGRSAAEVAQELGLTLGAVYAAKFRVLGRLRQELEGLLD